MARSLLVGRDIVDHVLDNLRLLVGDTGDAEAPDDTTLPYGVLYPIGFLEADGDLEQPVRDGWYEFQITTVGLTREQAHERAAGYDAILLTTLDVSDVAVRSGALTARVGPYRPGSVRDVADRDDDVQPPLHYIINTYEVFVASPRTP